MSVGGDFEDVFSNRTLDGTGRICVSVAITDDGDFEREEYFSVELMSFQQTPVPSGSCMVIITDNDGKGIIIVDCILGQICFTLTFPPCIVNNVKTLQIS